MLTSLEIFGLRGFATREVLNFGIPNGSSGSGLTILVGANNAGKSTAIEALRALTQPQPPSITQGRRNKTAGDLVEITLTLEGGQTVKLKSEHPGTSETKFELEPQGTVKPQLFVLPSRRVFGPYFGKGRTNRVQYMNQAGFPTHRSSTLDQITSRLFAIQSSRERFDEVMVRIVDPVPNWTIDQDDSGNWFLKLTRGDAVHSSEGLGEGLVSLIYIVDALYDSEPGQFIAIDEPELSLHPALQRKLVEVLQDYAKDRGGVKRIDAPFSTSNRSATTYL